MNNQTTFQSSVVTGDRPTGSLHLGHYAGSLQKRLALQESHEQIILIADLQALTDNGSAPKLVADNILNLVADYLAVGIDPSKSTICLQSALPALPELTIYYLNLVSLSRLMRNPTVKNEIKDKEFGAAIPSGFVTYPVSQAADITAFKGTLVPVGDDQLPMIEQTNEIVRKINSVIGKDILPECKPLLSDTGRLPAPDGKNKMSKSLGNCIYLGSSPNEITKAVRNMYTDPHHIRVEDPGKVEGNIVFTYLDAFHSDKTEVENLKRHYTSGGLGDSKVKAILDDCLQTMLARIRERRSRFLNDKGELLRVLQNGTEKARERSQATLQEIKNAFGINVLNS